MNKELVNNAFWEIMHNARYNPTVGRSFNDKVALKHISVKDMLKQSAKFVEDSRSGSTLHFSLALIAKLVENDISAFLISKGSNDSFGVGYCDEDGNILVADISAILTMDKNQITKSDCKRNSAIPLETFQKNNIFLQMYSCVLKTGGKFFPDYLRVSRQIA